MNTVGRPVEPPDGVRTEPVRYLEIDGAPEGRLGVVADLDPEFRHARHLDHPNGARDLVEAVLCVPDGQLRLVRDRYERYPGRPVSAEGPVTVLTEAGLPDLLPGEEPPALPALVACTVAVPGIARVRALLAEHGLPVRAASAWHGTALGRPCVVPDVAPHPVWADPDSPWCPPGAASARLVVDTATGFLLEAATTRPGAPVSHARVDGLADPVPVLARQGDGPFGTRGWRRPDPDEAGDAAWTLGRMAATLLEPLDATARVTVHSEARGRIADDPESAPEPGERRWTVTAERAGDGERTVVMGDGPVPQNSRFAIARLAEMLTPARIVSHLRRAEIPPGTDGTTVTATVRPMRAFPLSFWAPDEDVECRFIIDPTTGLLTEVIARLGDRELAHYGITSLRT